MIVAIHQPNFAPWLGFFDKMRAADLFVLLDTVPYTKGGYQNRTRIKSTEGAAWLTIPVITKASLGQLTRLVAIDNTRRWAHAHRQTLESCYRPCPGYSELLPQLERVYAQPPELLVDFTAATIGLIRSALAIDTGMIWASELDLTPGAASEYLAEIVSTLGGSVYLSGVSGRRYLDETPFHDRGLEVRYQEFVEVGHQQRFGSFLGGLSALDLLLNDPELARTWAHPRAP
jgi:hypothetical protein